MRRKPNPKLRGDEQKPDMRRDASGVIYMSQSLRFRAPVRPGDTVHAKVTVKEVIAEKGRVVLDTVCTVGDTVVIDGEATLMPTSRRKREAAGK